MIKKISFYILTFLQIVILVALKVVHNLSSKKAGVNHHLRYYKSKYNYEIFTENNVFLFKIVISIIILLLLISFIYCLYKKRNAKKLVSILLSILCSVLLIYMMISSSIMSLLIYPYMIFGTVVILIIQIIKIFLRK